VLLVVAVLVGGILIGLALGGSLRNLADARLRWWPLAIAGLLLQLIPVPSRPGQLDHWVADGLLIGSYVVLLVFVAANIRLPGFALIAVGFALNAVVIGINGGMPVKDRALRQAAGSRYEGSRQRLLEKGGLKHHLAKSDDVLLPLSDVVGIGGPVGNVFSPGDLLSYAGVAWALAELTRRPRDPRRRSIEASVTREPGGGPAERPPDPRPTVRLDPRASDQGSPPP
jgi:Family of unknown function (DUF5317)